MKWNFRNVKAGSLFFLAALLIMTSGTALAQPTVDIKVNVKGDTLYVDLVTQSDEPALRMNPEPSYLELAFAKGKLTSGSLSQAIDRGLVQKVTAQQAGESIITRVYVVSKPKASLQKTASGYRYTVKLQEMAAAPVRPVIESTPPNQAAAPVTEVKPSAPTADTKPVSPPVDSKPAQTSPAPSSGPGTPVTAKFDNVPIAKAIAQMAKSAGLNSNIDPKIQGSVTQVFTNVPIEKALRTILASYGSNVETTFANKDVTVRHKTVATVPVAAPPATSPATTSPAVTVTAPATPPPATTPSVAPATTITKAPPTTAREYFPFKSKSAEKNMAAAKLAFPNVTYIVDPILNILMVEGSPEELQRLEKFLRAQSPK